MINTSSPRPRRLNNHFFLKRIAPLFNCLFSSRGGPAQNPLHHTYTSTIRRRKGRDQIPTKKKKKKKGASNVSAPWKVAEQKELALSSNLHQQQQNNKEKNTDPGFLKKVSIDPRVVRGKETKGQKGAEMKTARHSPPRKSIDNFSIAPNLKTPPQRPSALPFPPPQ